jgi:RNA-binding protein YhbY
LSEKRQKALEDGEEDHLQMDADDSEAIQSLAEEGLSQDVINKIAEKQAIKRVFKMETL